MANYLDFLVALDEHIAASSLGYVIYDHEMHGIAHAAGLVVPGDQSAARWTGELVHLRYVTHRQPGLGDQRPVPQGAYTWEDLSRFSDYRITYEGRTEADRVRRQRCEALTDAAIGGVLPKLVGPWLSEPERNAILVPFGHLRSALDNEQPVGAVGAAKDLAEAACKLALARAGRTVSGSAALPSLFKEALDATGAAAAQADVGRSLAATLQPTSGAPKRLRRRSREGRTARREPSCSPPRGERRNRHRALHARTGGVVATGARRTLAPI